ncbi:hypothetical protein BKA62DRAFT_692934 [Auriculariales sp. MPI-PUGE-AT-0066]|nr:hypothetical protein BKA62DRAFT_692934 [Auriculariales sp. MPI-PUGE-AT-0066]
MAHVVDHHISNAFLPHNPKLAGGYGPYSPHAMAASLAQQPQQFQSQQQQPQYSQQASVLAAATNMFSSQLHSQAKAGISGTKRRDRDDEDENGYYAEDRHRGSPSDPMETRSPTPERPRKGPPKRLKLAALNNSGSASKDKDAAKEPDRDVGVLIARLPPDEPRNILLKLMAEHPELKVEVLAMIPPPDLVMAKHALSEAARKVRDAYPFSQSSSSSSFGASTSFGFGTSFSSGAAAAVPSATTQRPEYIMSRIQPSVDGFISTVHTYLPYFSYVSATAGQPPPNAFDSFSFLTLITESMLEQQPLAVDALSHGLRQRLVQEWTAWIEQLSLAVNQQGRMFAQSLVQDWVNRLDAFANHTHAALGQDMRAIRDMWVQRVGWLIGRSTFSM